MAAATQSEPQSAASAKPAAGTGKSSSASGFKPDIATLAGIALAFGGIIGGLILEKGKIQDIMQMTAAMIVLGGTFGAVLVTMPLPVVLGAIRSLKSVFFDGSVSPRATIDALIQYATKARKNGIVSLESESNAIADPFMRKALNLAVDGTDLNELRKMMETDIALTEQAGENEAKVWEAAGGYAPTIGIIGAVLGLIQVMKHLEDIKEVGHGIAVAFVATVYGVGSANIFFLPMANKLRARMREGLLLKEMTLEGVVGIVEGLNPTLIRLKLEGYDRDSGTRAAKAGTEAKEKAGPAAAKKRGAIHEEIARPGA